LKSGFEGSSTITNSEGFQNLISASLSTMAWPAFASWAASAGRAFCRRCCFVSVYRARRTPAARKREVSELALRLVSSWKAYGWSCGEQLHEGPFTGQPDSA
jgi:polyferredoxin